jgi:hypothetical protein
VQQPVEPGKDLDEGTEIDNSRNRTEIRFTDLGFGSKSANSSNRHLCSFAVSRCNKHCSAIVDVDLGAGFFGDRADHLTARSNDVTDLVRRNV